MAQKIEQALVKTRKQKIQPLKQLFLILPLIFKNE